MQIFQRRARPSSHFVARENDDEIRLIIMGLAEKKLLFICVCFMKAIWKLFFSSLTIYMCRDFQLHMLMEKVQTANGEKGNIIEYIVVVLREWGV